MQVMKDVAQYTRVTPQQRVLALRKYIENVRSNEKAKQVSVYVNLERKI